MWQICAVLVSIFAADPRPALPRKTRGNVTEVILASGNAKYG
jgi:hypothetical protein